VFICNPVSQSKSVHYLRSAGGQSGTDVDMACSLSRRVTILNNNQQGKTTLLTEVYGTAGTFSQVYQPESMAKLQVFAKNCKFVWEIVGNCGENWSDFVRNSERF
jgi:ATPase subunit of ABC transporter with duplicated ATPase domains